MKRRGRPEKENGQVSRNAGLCCFPDEIKAMKRVAKVKRLKTPFDYLRSLMLRDNHPAARGLITLPRSLDDEASARAEGSR